MLLAVDSGPGWFNLWKVSNNIRRRFAGTYGLFPSHQITCPSISIGFAVFVPENRWVSVDSESVDCVPPESVSVTTSSSVSAPTTKASSCSAALLCGLPCRLSASRTCARDARGLVLFFRSSGLLARIFPASYAASSETNLPFWFIHLKGFLFGARAPGRPCTSRKIYRR